MDLGCLQRFVQTQRWQDRWQPAGQHGFARARRAYQYYIVAACGGNFQRAFNVFLAAYLAKIAVVIG
jgi:hypothetical protein